jgi:MFS family permease
VLSTGMATTAAGLALMCGLTVSSSWTALVPGLLVTGFGVGIANPAIAKIGLGVVPPQRAGMASGISNTCRIGGMATGVAALGAIFQHHLATSASQQAFVSGINEILAIGSVVVLLGAIAALALVRARDLHQPATVAPHRPEPVLQPAS